MENQLVVVTGASSGIGRSLIKAIRSIAPHVVVCNLSRNKPDFFTENSLLHFPTDLSDPKAIEATADEVLGVLPDNGEGQVLLINNSGFGDYGRFQQLDSAKQLEMIDVNVRAVVDLTSRLLPALIQRGGTIVTIASTAAFQPTAYLATYGATKSFVRNWSLALNEDLRGTKVRALAVCPGPTRSNFFKTAGFKEAPLADTGGFLDMTSEAVADKTVRAITNERSLLVTGLQNKLITTFARTLPIRVITRVAAAILKRMRLNAHT